MIAGNRNKKIVIQQRTTTQDATYGTQSVTWSDFATVWAEVQDLLPSRAERVAEGINLSKRPCRIRFLYTDGIDTTMRVKIGSRYLQIVAGPAELGNREGVEIVAEEISTAGVEP